MSSRWWIRVAAPALAAAVLMLAPGLGAAQGPEVAVSDETLMDPFGPNSPIYWPGWSGPGGILNYPGYYGPGYVGSLWYWPNPHWPSRSWYMTYNAGPGGYRVFYPRGNGNSYYYSHRTGIRPWMDVTALPIEDRSDWQFPRDATPTRHSREPLDPNTPVSATRLQDPSTALIDVRLPADAELFMEDRKMGGKGPTRLFLSPSLASRRDYVYTLRARWKGVDGREYDEIRRVTVRAGATVTVEFDISKK
jgi:uncharacterized protein (TIGR03000 family)